MSQARYQKQLRERARREKATAKRERREARQQAAASSGEPQQSASQADILANLAALHDTFAQGGIPFDEFERCKHDLIAQLDD